MVLIELIRLFIRPVTLSVRLMANITAGHLIIIMIAFPQGMTSAGGVIVGEVVICVLELCVAIIQPYVFFILAVLYMEEVA